MAVTKSVTTFGCSFSFAPWKGASVRSPFQLYSRQLKAKDGATKTVLYVRYWDKSRETYLCTKSINELNYKLGDTSGKNKKSRMRASAIAQEALDKGLIAGRHVAKKISFESYARKVWDYDTSDYIRRKNQEKAGSISRIYADGQLGWLIREVFPYIKKESVDSKKIKEKLKTGDIIALVSKTEGLDVTHMAIIVQDEKGKFHMLHASSTKEEVVIEKDDLKETLRRNRNWIGIRIIRLKNNY